MVQKINYQIILDKELEKAANSYRTPLLFLHCCCAPCSSYVLEYLSEYFNIMIYYYNPNINPESEYKFRLEELERLVREMPHKNEISFVPAEYDENEFYELVKGHEKDPERGERCKICLSHRIEKTAEKAVLYDADFFTTTLSISPMKDAQFLNECGDRMAAKYDIPYLFSDFKKKGGYIRSIELSHQYNLYRQNYCGCAFSKRNDIPPVVKVE